MHIVKQNGNICFKRREAEAVVEVEASPVESNPTTTIQEEEHPSCREILAKLIDGLATDRDVASIARELKVTEKLSVLAREQILLEKIRLLEEQNEEDSESVLDEGFAGRWKDEELVIVDYRSKLTAERDEALERAGRIAVELVKAKEDIENKNEQIESLKNAIVDKNLQLAEALNTQIVEKTATKKPASTAFRFFTTHQPTREEEQTEIESSESGHSSEDEKETIQELKDTIARLEAEKEAYIAALSEANDKLR